MAKATHTHGLREAVERLAEIVVGLDGGHDIDNPKQSSCGFGQINGFCEPCEALVQAGDALKRADVEAALKEALEKLLGELQGWVVADRMLPDRTDEVARKEKWIRELKTALALCEKGE